MKILIVDDERSIRNSLKEILSDEGYDVDVAEDGATALAMVDKERYNVIFCDIKMPGRDGTEVLDKMVAEGIDSAIVMISGHGDRTVHLDVRHRASGTLLVETPRNQLLARTVGADDHHTGVSRGDLRNDVALMPDRL